MKKVYVIAYQFKSPSLRSHESFYDEIKRTKHWCHYIDRTWLVATEETAQQLYDRLKPHVGNSINLLIIEAGRDRQGWLPSGAWEWIKKHLGNKSDANG